MITLGLDVKMLTPEQIQELDRKFGAAADKLIARNKKTVMPPRSESAPGTLPVVIQNPLQPEMLDVLHSGEDNWPLWVDDVIQGIARLDWYRQGERSVPLSGKKIVQCLAYLNEIGAFEVSHLLQIGKRQSTRYVKACELAIPRLLEGYCNDKVRCMRYPDVFVYPKDRFIPTSDLGDD